LPNDKQAPKELKVTDKRIFTADGEIRDEFKTEIRPASSAASAPAPAPETNARAEAPAPQQPRAEPERRQPEPPRNPGEKGVNPGTPFTNFIEQLILQAYMSLGMLRNPYQPEPQSRVDAAAARQMIDILTLLKEKTAGNLTPEEDRFLQDHLADLKLAFVQRTKSI
jgi:hypothetical protein